MSKLTLTIATRESPLAIKQTQWVKDQLLMLHPHLSIDFLGITTQADKMLETSLEKLGGKGWFVKELEEALCDGRADLAVHSMKDVPMNLPPDLILPVICKREDPRDAFVSNQYTSLADLPEGASLGTSSLRRQTQLWKLRPDLNIISLRGNVNTRLQRLDEGKFAGIVLAVAGLKRMDLTDRITDYLSPEICLPAAGQGALGIECRAEDNYVQALIAPLNHLETNACVTAERMLCRRLDGGCTVPIGAYATLSEDHLMALKGLVADPTGQTMLVASCSDHIDHLRQIEMSDQLNKPTILGARVADALIEQGAEAILSVFRAT